MQLLKVGSTAGMQLLLQEWESQPHLGQGACARLLLWLCRRRLLRCGDGGLLLLLLLVLKGRLRTQRGGWRRCQAIGRLHGMQEHASRKAVRHFLRLACCAGCRAHSMSRHASGCQADQSQVMSLTGTQTSSSCQEAAALQGATAWQKPYALNLAKALCLRLQLLCAQTLQIATSAGPQKSILVWPPLRRGPQPLSSRLG